MKAEIGDLGWEAVGASDSTVMILTCPECATSYFVDDSRIAAAGRTVKCSNCGARWTAQRESGDEAPASPTPSAAPAPAPSPPQPPITPVDELVIEGPPVAEAASARKRPAGPKREANGKVMVWAGSAVAAVLLIAAAIVFRGQIVQLFPASQAAFAGLGLPVSSLVIEKVHADPGFQGGRAVLSVTGQIRNLRDESVTVPALRVTLLDRLGKPVATKIARPINDAAPAKAVRHFAISIVDPPTNLHDLDVVFEPAAKGAKRSAPVPISTSTAPPQPAEAKPLPPGSPDALPPVPK